MTEAEAIIRDEERELGYVITKESNKDKTLSKTLFLVDRNRIRDKWWSLKLSDALSFQSEEGALKVASKLRFGKIDVQARINFHKH
jgi:DNA-nicking Smr family endonuclease